MAKTCTKCKIEKPLDEFSNEAKRKDGKYPWCRLCLSLHRKERYTKTPREYWITHKVCSKCKEWKPREEYKLYSNKNIHYRCIACENKEIDLANKNLSECSSCNKIKPLEQFYKSRIKKTSRQCIECHKAYHSSKEGYAKRRNSALIKYFGITLDHYKQLLEKQNHKCPICLKDFEENVYSYPVDHAHGGPNAGVIRAILHDYCNRFIMVKHTDPDQLRRAADLLENPLTDWFVPEDYLKSRKGKTRKKKK